MHTPTAFVGSWTLIEGTNRRSILFASNPMALHLNRLIMMNFCMLCVKANGMHPKVRIQDLRRGRFQVNVLPFDRVGMHGLTERDVVFPSYDAAVLNKWGFDRTGCAPGDDFLVANTGMVSGWICQNELAIVNAMASAFRRGCSQPGNLMLDVGSNTGFYGLLAIAHGCRATFFDPQPGCNKVVNAELLVNRWTTRGVVVGAGLAADSGNLSVDSKGDCGLKTGRFPLNAEEDGSLAVHDAFVPVEPLTSYVHPNTHVLLMKVDTEGLEHKVLQGAMPLFVKKRIKTVIVEVTPGHGIWEKRGVNATDVAAVFAAIMKEGYVAKLLDCTDQGGHPLVNVILTNATALGEFIMERSCGQGDIMFWKN